MELDKLFISHQDVDFNGTKIRINDISLEQLPLITRVLSELVASDRPTVDKINHFVTHNFEDCVLLISEITEIPKESVKKLRIDAVVFIVSKVLELNVEFLKKNVLPQVNSLVQKVNSGLTQSKS